MVTCLKISEFLPKHGPIHPFLVGDNTFLAHSPSLVPMKKGSEPRDLHFIVIVVPFTELYVLCVSCALSIDDLDITSRQPLEILEHPIELDMEVEEHDHLFCTAFLPASHFVYHGLIHRFQLVFQIREISVVVINIELRKMMFVMWGVIGFSV